MPEQYLLGIDVGTSAIKCVVFDRGCNEVAISKRKPEIKREQPGWSEVSMDGLWEMVLSAIQEVTSDPALAGGKIVGVGIAGTACGAWLLDEHNRPVRKGILWNDGRAADLMGTWQQEGLLDTIFSISGNAIFPGYPLPLLRWLLDNEPDSLEKARYYVFCKDWIRLKLTGEVDIERSDMGYMPYDICKGELSKELMQLCGISSTQHLFGDIVESDKIVGVVQTAAAEQTGLESGIPVIGGLVDVAATTLGSGAYLPGQACSIVGTSFLNNLVGDKPSFEPAGIGAQTKSVNNAYIRSMINTSGTINLDWFLNQFYITGKNANEFIDGEIYNRAEQEAGEIPIGSGGIIYHPYINTTGVISPFVNPTARAQFFGISIEHKRAHLLRAIYEGTALSMLDCYSHFPVEVDQLFISGGGSRSPFWCQMFADCTGKEILVPSGRELGARGVVILAGIACGIYEDLDDAMKSVIHIERKYTPNQSDRKKYQNIYELYRQIYKHVAEDWWERHRLLQSL